LFKKPSKKYYRSGIRFFLENIVLKPDGVFIGIGFYGRIYFAFTAFV
jgi:hypothetical protein